MSAKQKADLLLAAKLRDSRIKRLLLEAKIEKTSNDLLNAENDAYPNSSRK